jgi:LmbE family N-acetylglucosaminyl deacetylase
MNIVVIAPHPDDEAIGCGGAIAQHVWGRDRVVTVFLTSGELGLKHLPTERAQEIREAEAKAAAKVLGVSENVFLRCPDWYLESHVERAAEQLRPVLRRERPDIIYLPHPLEWHPDHKASLPIVRKGLEGLDQPTPVLLAYEVWTPLSSFDHVNDISTAMSAKLKAVRCYKSQLPGFQYDRATRGLNQFRGRLTARCRFAEVYQSQLIDSTTTA